MKNIMKILNKYSGIIIAILFILFLESIFLFMRSKFIDISLLIMPLFNDSPAHSIIYSFVFLVSVLGISVIPLIKNKYITVIIGFAISFAYAIDFIYMNINGIGFSLNDLSILSLEFQNYFHHVFYIYYQEIAYGVLIGISVFTCFRIIRTKIYFRISNYFVILPILSIFCVFIIQLKTNATFSLRIPSPYKFASYLIYWNSYQPYYGDRENLKIQPVFPKKYDNIIWIIDCSVNANYLGINDSHYKTTPFLDSISNMYVNSGCLAAITNCSSISNIFLMGMGNKNNLPDHGEKLLKQASIFAYAKNANYKTAYISAQSQNNRLQNYMSNFDLEDIDYFYQPTSKEKKDMVYADEYLANKIKDYLTRYNGSFIYVVKSGSHFPWQQNYPIEQAIYKPSLIGSQNISSSDYQTRLNTYLNAIHWKTDHFFRTLLSDFSILDNNLFVYTSDHGQVIPNDYNKQTHCNTDNPDIQEGIVPLLSFSSDLKKIPHLKSIFELIPVTLDAMGYSSDVSGIDSYIDVENTGFFYGHMFPNNYLHQHGIKSIIGE